MKYFNLMHFNLEPFYPLWYFQIEEHVFSMVPLI
jgi:hypothetical protein